MPSQIVCGYTVTAAGSLSAAAIQARMAAVGVDNDLLRLYGLSVSSDNTSTVGSVVTRTVVLAMTADFKAMFPDGTDQGAPVANWMTAVLQQSVMTPVAAAAPIVS
jgi:hypothetical protein